LILNLTLDFNFIKLNLKIAVQGLNVTPDKNSYRKLHYTRPTVNYTYYSLSGWGKGWVCSLVSGGR